jgi:hypothetical protein
VSSRTMTKNSDNDEGTAEGAPVTEQQQRSKPSAIPADTENSSAVTGQDTGSENLELPRTAGEEPLLAVIRTLSLLSAVALNFARRLPNSQ